MGNVICLSNKRHARASTTSTTLKKASIGTRPPEMSLRRLASPKDASFRPAKMLRKCASEQSAASASCLTVISFASAQRSIGCDSDMAASISTRNAKSQSEIFLSEMTMQNSGLVKCGMGKHADAEPPEIYLREWLDLLETEVGEAAEIAGCDQSYISNIIAGRKPNVNVLYLLRLSEKLGVTVNDFYRPLPSKSQLDALKKLSPKAQATVLARQQKKA